MATTSPDGIVSPDTDTPVDFVADWAATASSIQTALSNRATRRGTTAQRTSATGVREGTLWSDSTTSSLWLFTSGAWVEVSPGARLISTPGSFTPTGGLSVSTLSAYKIGQLVTITVSLTGSLSYSTAGFSLGNLGSGLRPVVNTMGIARSFGPFYTGAVLVSPGGDVALYGTSASAVSRSGLMFSATFPGF